MTRIPELPGPSARPTSATPRFIEIDSDNMEPTLRRGDVAVALPIDAYRAEGLYVIEVAGIPAVYRCHADFRGGVDIIRDNKAYLPHTITLEASGECVLGKVFAICKVVDHSILAEAASLFDVIGPARRIGGAA